MLPAFPEKSLFDRPSLLHSEAERCYGESYFPSPFSPRHSEPVVFDVLALTAIPVLFLLRSPSAIARFIVAIVVDALDGKARRARPHIRHEGRSVLPALAKLDPPPGVVTIMPAPIFNAFPNFVLARTDQPVRGGEFSRQASATANAPNAYVPALHGSATAAIANAVPIDGSARPFTSRFNKKASEFLPRDVDHLHWAILQECMG